MDTPPAPVVGLANKQATNIHQSITSAKTPFQNNARPNFYRSEQPLNRRLYLQNRSTATTFKTNKCPSSSILKRINFSKNEPTAAAKTPKNNQSDHVQKVPQMIKYQVCINSKVYKILRLIGSGGSAKVFEGFEAQSQKNVAIKIVNLAKADPITHQSYFNEVNLLKSLKDCSRVVRMYDSEFNHKCQELLLVMEKGDSDLSQVIDSHIQSKDKRIDGIFIKYYWRGMLSAVDEIHKRGIVHADLKPVNFILIRNVIKLIDFGIAHAIAPDGTSVIRDFQIGTMNYMAPESLKNRASDDSFQNKKINEESHTTKENKRKTVIKYNKKADIWSLGCILYNLVYGRPPFDKYGEILAKMQAIVNPNQEIDFPPFKDKKLLYCLKSCLKYYPEDRPSAEQLLDHPYLSDDMIEFEQST